MLFPFLLPLVPPVDSYHFSRMARKIFVGRRVASVAPAQASVNKFVVHSRDEFRSWLETHHASESKVQLVCWKAASGRPTVSHNELMREAICWGWIDTIVHSIDDNSYQRTFVRRTATGKWSTNTIRYAEELRRQGLMKPAGLEALSVGKTLPIYDSHAGKQPPPAVLLKALAAKKKAKVFWDTLPPSAKSAYIAWVVTAKRKDTVMRRVATIVARCALQLRR